MARPAPGVSRTVAVLNFIAAHPEQSFTLTDIIRSLELNRATCHSLLAALVSEGYLYRDNAKSYRLGPALAALGEVAHRSFRPATLARDDMRRLADETGMTCIGAARVGSEMVILERAIAASQPAGNVYPGLRVPLRPPAGVSFIAWAPESEVSEWLETCRPALNEGAHAGWRAAFERIREQGFCFGVRGAYPAASTDDPSIFSDRLQPDNDPSSPSKPPPPVAWEAPIQLSYVSAPVLNAAHEIIFSVALNGFDGLTSQDEIRELGRRVKAVSDRVTKAIGGRLLASFHPGSAAVPIA